MSETHPVIGFIEGKDAIKRYSRTQGGFSIAKNPKISNALNDLACAPFTSFMVTSDGEFGTVKDKTSFGSTIRPKVDNIVEIAKKNQSKFGRGKATVLDLNYRNGFEIEAKNLDTSHLAYMESQEIKKVLEKTLFVGKHREPTLRLYKLAVYQEGGHFDWHRDTTHGDNHHGTVLVALNTSWKGGELSLRHRGVESTFDMQPVTIGSGKKKAQLSVVAFYTDVEHKVSPVTKGVRIILQYDVYLPEDSKGNEAETDSDEADSYNDEADPDSDEADMYPDDDDLEEPYGKLSTKFLQERFQIQLPNNGIANEEALDHLVQVLTKEFANPRTDEIGFPLRHLYRQQSILPQYLKGVDALAYRRLSKEFDVSLCPIMLSATTNYEDGSYSGDGASSAVVKCLPSTESDSHVGYGTVAQPGLHFYLYDAIDIRQISVTQYIEHTGNEAQEGSCQYFGGGIFLRPKTVTGKRVHKGGSTSKRGKKAKK